MHKIAANLFFIILFSLQLYAFDNGGNPQDGNGNCPGENIYLSPKGPIPFRVKGNVRGDHSDWVDRFKFSVPNSGRVKITLNSTNHTNLDFKMSDSACNRDDLTRQDDDYRDTKSFSFNATAHHTYYLSIFDNEWRDQSNPYILTIDYLAQNNGKPPKINSVPDLTVANNQYFSRGFESFVTKTDGDSIIKYQLIGTLPSGISFSSSKGILSGRSTKSGDYQLSIKAKDKDGWSNAQSWTLHIKKATPKNIPPIMNNIPNETFRLNRPMGFSIASHVTKTDNDPILKYHLSGTLPDGLSFNERNGKISGTPNNSAQVNHDFWLKAWATDKDGDSNKKSFKIHIVPKGTDITQGDLPFYIVNSLESRNIRGNYLILGNTVECHTPKRNQSLFEQNRYCADYYYDDNSHISNYIDIDNDPKTWNSSSSNFTLPPNSKIVWAGLFWQANLNNMEEDHTMTYWQIQRHAEPSSSSNIHSNWRWVENDGSYFSIESTTANKVLLKFDKEKNYIQIPADTLAANNIYYGGNHIGGPYAAFADITKLIQKRNFTSGKHTITIANIVATQGMDGDWLGDYGGWSIAIVYQNKNESIKNISIFNGFTTVNNPYGNKPPKYITIEGFKLPKYHKVEGYLSVFSGEGEYNNHGDTMKLEGHLMPGISQENQYNVFDEISHGLDRDSTPWYNNLTYADTIDVDRYDVSEIMTELRDKNRDINSVKIEVATHQGPSGEYDAFFPSMFAFSTQLYVPKVCYDYDLKIGKYYDIASQNREFNTTALGNEPLQAKIMLKSKEADFDLLDAKMHLKFTPNNVFSFIQNSAQTSLPNSYIYHKALQTDANIGEIAVGSNETNNGGVIAPQDFTYSKLYYSFSKPKFDGKFDIYIKAKVSFDGIHKIPYTLSTAEPDGSIFKLEHCSSNPVYDPVYGMFNIERGDSNINQTPQERYSLYTQVVGVPYSVSVAAYKKDKNNQYTKPIKNSAIVELELIDASTFENNSSTQFDSICRDPDSYNIGKFVKFKNSAREIVKIPDDFPKINGKTTYPENLALRNAAFRVWVLTKKVDGQNQIIYHNCKSQSDSKCFERLYKKEYKETNKCENECSSSSGTQCYDCLRANFATPICSRDNFAIRPQSYHIALSDNNETHAKTKIEITNNSQQKDANIAAGYLYHLDINATKYKSTQNVTGYDLKVVGDQKDKKAQLLFEDSKKCNDRANYDANIDILNGKAKEQEALKKINAIPKNGIILNNSGKYELHIEDSEWTKVDRAGYPYKPFRNHQDCIANSSKAFNGKRDAKRGCVIQTGDSYNTFANLHLHSHPYKFSLKSIALNTNPNSGSKYIYINDLNSNIQAIQNGSIMAARLVGDIVALGKNNKTLSNYTKECSAQDLSITLDFNKTPSDIKDSNKKSLKLNYTLFDKSVDKTPVINKENTPKKITLNVSKNYFYKPSKASFNSYFNFPRAYNNPINPFKLNFGTISAKSQKEKLYVDLKQNYIPSGSKDINDSKTLYFAKVKSESDFYDDIADDNVTTPLYVSIFCNKSLDYCKKYGIDTKKGTTNEYNWWLNLNHNGSKEGAVILKATPKDKGSITPVPINNFTNGIAKDVTVISLDRLSSDLPYIVYIGPDKTMINNYPWLLYNEFENKAPKYLYKVRFVDSPSAWSGHGKTGYTISVGSTGRKSKKVDW